MTLHWWMHWFWITYYLFVRITHSSPISSATQLHFEADILQNRPLHRSVKSIGQPSQIKTQKPITIPFPVTSDTLDTTNEGVTPSRPSALCENAPVALGNATLTNENVTLCISSNTTVLLREEPHENVVSKKHDNETIDIAFTNSNESYTERNITDDVLNSTLTSVITTNEKIVVPGDENVSSVPTLTAASITGISFGVLIFAGLIGLASFVMYRRRYLNKPQTLNDKCSNPDSSGYIDDSTIRENSEEMYSLDNDSFLNSLEAMTIQNYWTDSVKHTKL